MCARARSRKVWTSLRKGLSAAMMLSFEGRTSLTRVAHKSSLPFVASLGGERDRRVRHNAVGRQAHGDAGALAQLADKRHMAALCFHQSFDDRKAQPRAFLDTGNVVAHLAKSLEHTGLVLGRDADAVVLDAEDDAIGLEPCERFDDSA